jgi:hypothetical protein
LRGRIAGRIDADQRLIVMFRHRVALMEGHIVPVESLAVLAFVGAIFAAFAIGLSYADWQTRKFRN